MGIVASEVTAAVRGRKTLAPVSLRVEEGRSLGLTGPSGSGKTTLLGVLGLLMAPDSGEIRVDGARAERWRDGARRRFWRRDAAFIFQDYGLIEEESAAYNVVLARPPLRARSALRDTRALEALAAVGLAGREGEPTASLSGGEKQRVGLARAIYKRARYIFADEPTASLDTKNRELVMGLLLAETRRGAAVVISTHDERLAEICDERVALTPAR